MHSLAIICFFFVWRIFLSVSIKDPQQQAKACVIWMHGMGANASDMKGLAEQLPVNDLALRHVFLDAPTRPVTLNGGMVMPAWYDILGLELSHREDKQGILQSALLIRQAISTQLAAGFSSQQIVLAGFSQGGAMALHTALHYPGQLAGVIALSAYLPLSQDTQPVLDKKTPFFVGFGQFDTLVLPHWTQHSIDWLMAQGYQSISNHRYPMEHSICWEEMKDLSAWLRQHSAGVSS
jgi:phospholipase/carboxylesterase